MKEIFREVFIPEELIVYQTKGLRIERNGKEQNSSKRLNECYENYCASVKQVLSVGESPHISGKCFYFRIKCKCCIDQLKIVS